MKKPVYKITLILLLTGSLFAGTCWFYSDQILDQVVRPRVENIAALLFETQARIGKLAWTETGLEMLDLEIAIPERAFVVIPRVELDFSISSLWHRQLEGLHISQPQIEISPATHQGKSAETPPTIPDSLPLTIKALTMTNGQLLINYADHKWQLHDLKFTGSLQKHSDFSFSAFCGAGEKHPVAILGSAELSQPHSVTLTSLAWQGQQLLTTPLQINLTGSDLTLDHSILRLERFDHIKLQSLLTALDLPSLLPEEMAFLLNDATLDFALEDQKPKLELQVVEGEIGWNDLNVKFTRLQLQLDQGPKGWQITIQLQGPAKSTLHVNTQFSDNGNLTGQAIIDLPDLNLYNADIIGGPAWGIIGSLQLVTNYSLQGDNLQLTTDIHGAPMKSPDKEYLLDIGKLSGMGKLFIIDNQEKVSLNLQLDSQPFLSLDGNFQHLNFLLTASALQDVKKLLAADQIPPQIHSLKDLKIAGQLSKQTADWATSLQISVAEVGLADMTMKAVAGRGQGHLAPGQASFNELAVGFTLARGDEFSTRVKLRSSAEFSPEKFSLVLQQLSLTQLNYMSADGQTGVGDAAITLQGEISGTRLDSPIAVNLHGTVAPREILAGDFYADLSTYRGNYSLSGNFAPGRQELTASSVKIEVPQLGVLAATGRFGPREISTQGLLELVELAESYGNGIRPLLSDFQPALTELTLRGGMSLDYNLLWNPETWHSNGILQLKQVDVNWDTQKLKMLDGNGSIPFAFSAAQKSVEAIPGPEYTGKISFGALSAGLATLEQRDLELAASNNRFSFLSPLRLRLAGGQVEIENLTLEWPAGQPQGTAKINIAEVDLETLTEELNLPVMQGHLNADLGTLRYANRQLSTDGLANIDVFGGHFQLRNMHYREPFSRYPTFHTDIDFSDLDLLQATRTFDFGEMNGLLDGHIHGLELFGSTPAAFSAAVATQNQDKRNISVKALNNLSILSQGGISAALSRGIYRFIDFYRYQKIGFKCALNNDTFTLVGTALAGSDRYLVHGGLLPPRIDITTTTPTISFKEMMNRLARINRAGN